METRNAGTTIVGRMRESLGHVTVDVGAQMIGTCMAVESQPCVGTGVSIGAVMVFLGHIHEGVRQLCGGQVKIRQ